MECRNCKNQCSEGRLPARAPLANPYVPFQIEDPPKYNPRKALVRGTLFPGLDLPFHGMVNKDERPVTPLSDLQAIAFAVQELALYLDTHPEDKDALEMYRKHQKLYAEKCEEYERKIAPLTHLSEESGCYRWPDDPWPWEYAKNREV